MIPWSHWTVPVSGGGATKGLGSACWWHMPDSLQLSLGLGASSTWSTQEFLTQELPYHPADLLRACQIWMALGRVIWAALFLPPGYSTALRAAQMLRSSWPTLPHHPLPLQQRLVLTPQPTHRPRSTPCRFRLHCPACLLRKPHTPPTPLPPE